jgi:hypothetical protein
MDHPGRVRSYKSDRVCFGSHAALFQNSDVWDSLCGSMPFDARQVQAIFRPLSHEELVQLQRIAAQAGVFADVDRQGYHLARAA